MTLAPKRRWFRFSLRTLLVVTALIGCVAAMRPIVEPSHKGFVTHGGYTYWSTSLLWDRDKDSIRLAVHIHRVEVERLRLVACAQARIVHQLPRAVFGE